MKQKQILVILIVIILAIVACLTAFMLVNSHSGSYTTLRISNSCTIEVPNEKNTAESMNGGISKFSFNSSNLTIMHQKSGNNSAIKSLNTEQIQNSQQIENNIYYDNSTGTYSIFIENKNTGDSLLITSNSLDLLKRVSNSVKFSKPTNTHNANNTTADNTTDDSSSNTIQSNNNQGSRQTNNNQSNNNPTPSPSPTPSDGGSDSDSKKDEDSKYPSFIPG